MQLRLDHGGSSVFQAFNRAVENMPEIQECHMVAGSFDYLLKIRLSSVSAYRQFMSERLPALPNVVQTQSHVVISAVKDSARLALGSAGDRPVPEDD
jgi:Lrp/AsnC family leucine-responsive transcriptional regulator